MHGKTITRLELPAKSELLVCVFVASRGHVMV